MTPERFASVRSCFEAVAELPPEERSGRLRELTGDAELVDEVLALCDAGAGDTRVRVSIGTTLESAASRSPVPGDVLGIWRVEREIGQGGMGSVFLAERDDGHFQQRAAVKLLRGLLNAESLALFTRERQLLATLTHPSIGRLLDGGATPQGRPYLVMEYVEGSHIDEHCRREKLGVGEILALFLTVCDAIAAAHRQLVIHCDLKPSNLLVDSHGRPVLLDFGIARLADRVEVDADGVAERAVPAFTPGYASPEQRSHGPVSTASDVYSLGVMLGELLESAADRRRYSALSRRELAAIVRCATREAPGERYATVDALMADIRRFLDRQPLQALHGVAGYGLRKELARRWPILAVAAAFLLTVAVFTTKLMVESRRAQAAEHAALRERDRARAAETSSRQASDFLISVFQGSNPNGEIVEIPMSKLVAQAEARIEKELAGQPITRSDVYGALAKVQVHLGNYQKAREHYGHAIEIERRQNRPLVLASLLQGRAKVANIAFGPHASEADLRESLALCERYRGIESEAAVSARASLADTLTTIGEYQEAEPLLLQSVRARERIGPPRALALALRSLGKVYTNLSQHDKAVATLRRSIDLLLAVDGESGADYLNTLESLGRTLSRAHRFAEAEAAFRRSLDITPRFYGAQSVDIAWTKAELARVLADAGRPRESLPLYHEGLAIIGKTLGERSPSYGGMLNNRAVAADLAGDVAAAEHDFDQALVVIGNAFGKDLVYYKPRIAQFFTRIGKLDVARPLIASALEGLVSSLGPRHPKVSAARIVLAEWYVKAGEAEKAREQLDLARSASPPLDLELQAASERQYALLQALEGRMEAGLRGLERAEDLDRQFWGERHLRYFLGKLDRAELLARGTAEQKAASATLAAEILKNVERLLVPGSPLLARLRKLARQPFPIS
jgi:tetratricopeptide (TPR) repeat protein